MHQTFTTSFEVSAPVSAVSAFHHEPRALQILTPPPVFIQFIQVEPLGEGSVSQVTMWMGPIPIRWVAKHFNVSENGFSDTLQNGPMRSWTHRHEFIEIDNQRTLISEHIEYEHLPGLKGMIMKLFFNNCSLQMLFVYRRFITRFMVKKKEIAATKTV